MDVRLATAFAETLDETAAPELLAALKDSNDLLAATFGQVGNPGNRAGWSDDDAFVRYQHNLAAIAKAEGRS